MTQEEMRKEIKERGKLTNVDFEQLAKVYSEDIEKIKKLYKEVRAAIKAEKEAEKLKKFETENCLFEYKGKKIAFKPVYLMIEDSIVIVWRTNLDKNGIYFIYENNSGSIVIAPTACVSSKSKSYEYRLDLVRANKSKVVGMMQEMLSNCTFKAFVKRAMLFKGFKEVAANGGLRNIKLKDAKANKEYLEPEEKGNTEEEKKSA